MGRYGSFQSPYRPWWTGAIGFTVTSRCNLGAFGCNYYLRKATAETVRLNWAALQIDGVLIN